MTKEDFSQKNPVAEKLEAFGGPNDGMNKVHIGGKIFIAKRPKPNTKPKELVDFPDLVKLTRLEYEAYWFYLKKLINRIVFMLNLTYMFQKLLFILDVYKSRVSLIELMVNLLLFFFLKIFLHGKICLIPLNSNKVR